MTETCTHVKPDGVRCTMAVGLLPGVDGLRCAWHDPARVAVRTARAAGPGSSTLDPTAAAPLTLADLPVASIESLDDAEALAKWAIVAVTLGNLSPKVGQAIVAMVREYRMVQADAGVLKKAAELVDRAEKNAQEFSDLRRRVAAAKANGIEV